MNEVQSAISELCGKYGYRDISTLIEEYSQVFLAEYPQFKDQKETYVCVLQAPDSSPIYCRTEERLFAELEHAQDAGKFYASCPAPDPRQNMWMVAGNFEGVGDDE